MKHGLTDWGELPIPPEPPAFLASAGMTSQQATTSTRTDDTLARRLRAAAWAGLVGPALFTAAFLVQEAFRRDEYSAVAETVSALEAGPRGWVQQVSFVVFGVLTMAHAWGQHRGMAPTKAWSRGAGRPLRHRHRTVRRRRRADPRGRRGREHRSPAATSSAGCCSSSAARSR